MTTIKERLATLETKVKLLILLVGGQLGFDLIPFVSAEVVTPIVENITRLLI
ncbi:hypothetical protein KAR91_65725 [Candidatus Pacearchaeota archaeon]|nr:hypothetical protein [Candidatus Pacearchaeota archaeon]